MSRLDIKTQNRAQTVVDNLYRDVERRIAASPPGLCPVDMSLAFLRLCHAQSCGKCVPCRIGLGQLSLLIEQVVDGTATMETLAIIEKTARSIVNTADCAIGRDAARLVVDGLEGFRDDYVEHICHHRCLAGLDIPVPCVNLCPAGVDIPGYMALLGAGRCADAVRLIRKPAQSKDDPKTGIVYDDAAIEGGWDNLSPEEIAERLNQKVEEGMINISMNTAPYFENGTAEGNLMLVNESINNYPQKVQIVRNDTGEQIYESGAIAVGSKIERAKLDVVLPAGTYECTAYFHNLDPETGEIIGTAGAIINITIKN